MINIKMQQNLHLNDTRMCSGSLRSDHEYKQVRYILSFSTVALTKNKNSKIGDLIAHLHVQPDRLTLFLVIVVNDLRRRCGDKVKISSTIYINVRGSTWKKLLPKKPHCFHACRITYRCELNEVK